MGAIVPYCLIKACAENLVTCHCRNPSWFIFHIHPQCIDRIDLTYNEKFHHLDTGIPINPQSWCHQCTNIDTRSGIIWSSRNQIVNNYIVKDTSSLLSMARFCLTKWFRFSEILTMSNQSHLKVIVGR